MNAWIRTVLFGGRGTATISGEIGLAILRVGIGLMMAIGHGAGKVFGEGRFGPSQGFIDGVARMGFPLPTVFAWRSALAEFGAALLLTVGLLTRPAALALTINMCVATFVAHWDAPLFMGTQPAKEPALLYLLPFVFFLFAGAGKFSLDRTIRGS